MNGFWNRQWRIIALLIGLLINVVPSYGQGSICPTSASTETGGFTVPSQICAGDPVVVTGQLPGLVTTRYYYNYDGNGVPNSASGLSSLATTYATPGSYTILQISTGSSNAVACRIVEVLPAGLVSFSTVSCANRLVTLTYTLDASTIRYDFLTINWGDGTVPATVILNHVATTGSVNHTYAGAATTYTAQVSGSYTKACSRTSQQPVRIQAAAAASPVVNALKSDATKATITYQGASGYNLELYRKGAGGIYAPTGLTGTSGGSFTVTALPTDVNCFQLVAKDACGTSDQRSAEVCSLVLTAKPESKKNTVSWSPYAGTDPVRLYRVYKNGGPAWVGQTSPYIDNIDVVCGKNYCYMLELTAGQTIVQSTSTCISGVDNESVDSPVSAYVSVQPNGVNVQATLPTVGLPSPYTLVITRAEGVGGAFNPIGVSNDRSYIDATAQTSNQSYCYQTAIRNSCGVLSKPTPSACTILLTKAADGSITWTPASPYSNEPPQYYQVIYIDPATGNSDKTKPLGLNTTFKPDPDSQVTQYQVTAVNKAGIESYSNPLEIELGLRVFVPTAFTPNGDNQNDSFLAKGLLAFWSTFEMTIYSRWGDVVYNTTDKNTTGWSGDINGAPAQSGYYGYRIRITDATGKGFERTGQVLLIR